MIAPRRKDMDIIRKKSAWVTVLVFSVLAAGCRLALPDVEIQTTAQPREISDAVHLAGNPHFFFLPPLVAQPAPGGVFQSDLSPVVEIGKLTVDKNGDGVPDACAIDASGNVVTIAPPFTTTSGPGSETIRVESDSYVVNWHTDLFDLEPGASYRIRVLVGTLLLGYADVIVGSSNSQLKSVDTSELIPLKDGRTLPIRFRIEEGALSYVGPGGGELSFAGGNVIIDVPEGALSAYTQLSAEPIPVAGTPLERVGLLPGGLFDFGPGGAFLQPITLTIKYGDDVPLPFPETDLALITEQDGKWIQLVSSVDPEAKSVSASIEHFTPVGKAPKVASINVAPPSTSMSVGDPAVRLTASTYDAAGTELFNRAVNWSDSPPKVVALLDLGFDANGRSIAEVSADPSVTTTTSAVVQARVANATGSCSVEVVVAGIQVTAVSAGNMHTMILMSDGRLRACGDNVHGQLGLGTIPNLIEPTQVMTGAKAVSAGHFHTLIVKDDGSLLATGYNSRGQLGDGTVITRTTPVAVIEQAGQPMSGVQAVSASLAGTHSAIVKSDGTLLTMGYNGRGQLGDLTTTDRSTPVQVMTGVQSVSAGGYHTLILKTDGTVHACGMNYEGQLGNGNTNDSPSPVYVISGAQAVSAGAHHTMILLGDGTLLACGSNDVGQLGDGTTTDQYTPIQVMTGVQAVSAGAYHTMILKTDGTVWACGYNYAGQLGDGTTVTRLIPQPVLVGVQAVSAGFTSSMALKTDGTVWGCGRNNRGQLGDGTTQARLNWVQTIVGP
jgi:alpha-tubulin suppressor-like RCC1 family protein